MTNNVIWYELLTSDANAAADFYGRVFGWQAADSGRAGMDYRILSAPDVAVGGLMVMPSAAAQSGMRPTWLSYIGVPNVDRSAASIVASGGALHMPAFDIPDTGRAALMADGQGAIFYIMTPKPPAGGGASAAFAPGKPGHGGWHELRTTDWGAALAFYEAQFGWKAVQEMSMGPLGTYLMFNFGVGDAVGGMMNDARAERPYWLHYFNVEAVGSAVNRVTANGGKMMSDSMQVPTGEWVAQARDPQGAMFALVGPKG